MKFSDDYILRYDPFDEEDWDEIETKLYELYFKNGKIEVEYVGEGCGDVCDMELVGVRFSDDVKKDKIVRTFNGFYGGIIGTHERSIFRSHRDIENIRMKYRENKIKLLNTKDNEIGVVDFGGDVKVGRIKHIRGNKWVVIMRGDRFPSLSNDEFIKLKSDGILTKGFTYFIYGYNKVVERELQKIMKDRIGDINDRVNQIKKRLTLLKRNLKIFNFDVLDSVLIKKT